VAGRGEEIDGIEPKLKRGARLLKWGADSGVKVVAAKLAGICPLGFDPEPLGSALALGALKALAEPNVEKVLQARLVIGKGFEELGDGEGLLAHPHYLA
jgi:hypothetical protein